MFESFNVPGLYIAVQVCFVLASHLQPSPLKLCRSVFTEQSKPDIISNLFNICDPLELYKSALFSLLLFEFHPDSVITEDESFINVEALNPGNFPFKMNESHLFASALSAQHSCM